MTVNTTSFLSNSIAISNDTATRGFTSDIVTYGSIGAYTLIEKNSSSLNYRNSSYQIVYVPAGNKNNVPTISPCLENDSLTLKRSMGLNQDENNSPSWVTLKDDFSKITVDAPTYSGKEESYYLGIQYNYSTYIYTQYSTLIVFECELANCASCKYSSKNTS